MEEKTFSALIERAKQVVQNLDWQIYHTPENLILFLIGEVAELGEYCQWLSKDEIIQGGFDIVVAEEIADVIKNVLYLANTLPLVESLELILIEKIKLDEIECPVAAKFRSKSRYELTKDEPKITHPLPTGSLVVIPPVSDIQAKSLAFNKDRKWEESYCPAILALSIAVKSGYIATYYQRRSKSKKKHSYEQIVWLLADILLDALRLYELLGINNAYEIIKIKFDKDEKRFKE